MYPLQMAASLPSFSRVTTPENFPMSLHHHCAWFAGGIHLGKLMRQPVSRASAGMFQMLSAARTGNRFSTIRVGLMRGMLDLPVVTLVERRRHWETRSAEDAGAFGAGALLGVVGAAWRVDHLDGDNGSTESSGTP